MPDLQIFAITRFAYPGLGGFQTEHETVEARQAHLWHPDRMASRMRTLEHVCLRTLAAQTDGDFRTLILTGDALPEPWRSRLVSLAAGIPGAEVIFRAPENHRDALRDILAARIDRRGPPTLQFRHDDDDGIARDFVARCRETYGQIRPLYERHRRLVLDFNRGLHLNLTAEGPRVQPLHSPHLGVAQALILPPRMTRTALHFPHHRLGTLMPSVTLPEAPMWLRGIDGTNDSRVKERLANLMPADAAQRKLLTEVFALDLPAIARSF